MFGGGIRTMTERQSIKTRYLTFKVDKYTALLAPHLRNVLGWIAREPEGITFEDLLMRASYKRGYMGPKLLRASLKHLFDRDYIITNYQIAKLSEKTGVDISKLRRYEQ